MALPVTECITRQPLQARLNGIMTFISALSATEDLTDDNWPLHPGYPQYFDSTNQLYYDTCYSTLEKEIEGISFNVLQLRMAEGCGDTNKLQFLMPSGYNWNKIRSAFAIRVTEDFLGASHGFELDVVVIQDSVADTITLTGWSLLPLEKLSPCLKLCNKPILPTVTLKDDCIEKQVMQAKHNAWVAYQDKVDSLRRAFRSAYIKKCLEAQPTEQFRMRYQENEFHYTLYYYDQAGNLVQTVPPSGVRPITNATTLAQVQTARKDTTLPQHYPAHSLPTRYEFNTLNQLVWQKTPDAGESRFWYDELGRLVLSQNAKQLPINRYSYTSFDALGRISEVGELKYVNSPISVVGGGTILAIPSEALIDGLKLQYVHTLAESFGQITRTYYDNAKFTIVHPDFAQQNLRSRVVSTTYQELAGAAFDYGTHYTYDIHGNVDKLVQHIPALADVGHNYKLITYDYDLVSGKVNRVTYQPGEADQYIHKYNYDADNRVINVNTSPDGVIWDEDARYMYMHHGPLARSELGDYHVQGVDYAYSVQGWIKGVNSNTLVSARDMGRDGDAASINQYTARDAYGYTLGYFSGDYTAIGGSQAFEAGYRGSQLDGASPSLYNGNIRHMVTAISKVMGQTGHEKPMARAFHYDQLNRLAHVQGYVNIDLPNNKWENSGTAYPFFQEHFNYDANGNILNAYRAGDSIKGGSPWMDSLTYRYYAGTNRLKYLVDDVHATRYKTDLDVHTDTLNYDYDAIGNLIKDKHEEIDEITWTVYGKVWEVKRTAGSTKPNLVFGYDASGHRVLKIVKKGIHPSQWYYHYYVRDAEGNELATYSYAGGLDSSGSGKDSLVLEDQDVYGAERLGLYRPKKTKVRRSYAGHIDSTARILHIDSLHSQWYAQAEDSIYTRCLGKKQYELSNHLGNVLVTVSDRRLQHRASESDTLIDYFEPDVITAGDYYAFGAPMPGRKWTDTTTYKVQVDTCISCTQLKTKLQAYMAANGGTKALRATATMASYLNTQFGFTRTDTAYLTAMRKCKLLNEGLESRLFTNEVVFTNKPQHKLDTGAFTFEVWVNLMGRPLGPHHFMGYFSGDFSGVHKMARIFLYNNKLTLWLENQTSTGINYGAYVYENVTFPNTGWQHLVAVKRTKDNNTWDMYINGVKLTNVTRTFNPTAAPIANDQTPVPGKDWHLSFGKVKGVNTGTTARYKQGRVYKRALDSIEVHWSYNQGCGNDPSDTSKLVLWAPLDEGIGVTFHDRSRYAEAATVTGSASDTSIWFRELNDSSCWGSGDAVALCESRMVDERLVENSGYRFGFNGQETVDEIDGEGDFYTAEFWMYDSRLGRRWNVDPVVKEFESPYACFGNNPFWFADPNGADTITTNDVAQNVQDIEQWQNYVESLKTKIENLSKQIKEVTEKLDEIEGKRILLACLPMGLAVDMLVNHDAVEQIESQLDKRKQELQATLSMLEQAENFLNQSISRLEIQLKNADAIVGYNQAGALVIATAIHKNSNG